MQPSKSWLNLEDLANPNLGKVICYPAASVEELKARIGELESLKVSRIILEGRTIIDGLPILGKGCTSTVVKAMADESFYALKARRTDSNRASMGPEAKLQMFANSISIGAKLISFTRNFILMELLNGPFLFEWINYNPTVDELRSVLTILLYDCFKMDLAGLDHGELTNASRHVIVEGRSTKNGLMLRPVIIDFESASLKRRTSNVTSICQFLFLSKGRGENLDLIKGIELTRLVEALKAYKARPCRETFNLILYSSGLMVGQ